MAKQAHTRFPSPGPRRNDALFGGVMQRGRDILQVRDEEKMDLSRMRSKKLADRAAVKIESYQR